MIVSSIDIGTNTIILLIAEVNLHSGEIKAIENFYNIPRIGKGLKEGNPIPDENLKRLFEVLTEHSAEINKYKAQKVIVTGTNALRIASNKSEIADEIKKRYNFELNIISGEEEAKFSYLGAISDLTKDRNYLVIDIGGGSTEIIYGMGTDIRYRKSFQIGVVSGTENYLKSNLPSEIQIQYFIKNILEIFNDVNQNILAVDIAIAIAGTPTTLACIKHNLKTYNEDLVEGSTLTINELANFAAELSGLSPAEILNKYSQVVKGREDILLAGTIILHEIGKILKLNELKVSTKGIRYGAIINWLNNPG